MDALQTFDIRGKRLSIYLEEMPDHPLNTTDAPVTIYSCKSSYKEYWRNHSIKVYDESELPKRNPKYKIIYFRNEGDECERCMAEGAMQISCAEWLAYAGAPLTMRTLRAFLAECAAFWDGRVYGYNLTETFVRNGKLYDTEKIISDCWGFYGLDGVLFGMADYVKSESPTLARALKKWAKRYL